jgi:transposase
MKSISSSASGPALAVWKRTRSRSSRDNGEVELAFSRAPMRRNFYDKRWLAPRRPRVRRSGTSSHSTRSRGRSAAAARRGATSCDSRRADRCRCLRGLAPRQAGSHRPEEQTRRRHSLRALIPGMTSRASLPTAASNSTTTRSNDQSVASSSVARTRCLPNSTVAPNTGLSWRSLIETCRFNGIDPLALIADVLTRIINGHPNRDIDRPLPWTYRTHRRWAEEFG